MKKIALTLFISACSLTLWGQADYSLIGKMLPASSEVGISIYDLTDSKPLYAYQPEKLARPASTMKLLTTITSLARPDADDPFRTEVWIEGEIARDTLFGNLYVIGGFDPEFGDAAMDSLVSRISSYPFSAVKGQVYGDVSMKDSLYWGKGWAWDDTPEAYQPYLSPLMFCKDAVEITATPVKTAGDKANISCKPISSFYSVDNRTESRSSSAGKFALTRDWLRNGNQLVASGNVAGTRKGSVNIYDAPGFFMHTFIERLQAKGISTPDHYRFAEFPTSALNSNGTPVSKERLAYWETPIQDVLDQLMKESDNLNAEALLCRLGAQATGKKQVTAEDGIAEILKLVKKLGHDPDDYKMADGCGLSNYNYISPALLVDFLKYAYSDSKIFQKLYKALPVGGVEGTLKNRMKSKLLLNKVHAKTGSFTAINALAGYLRMNNGHDVAFAIMNRNVLQPTKARAFQDKVCEVVIGN